jgi:hypothetical protein
MLEIVPLPADIALFRQYLRSELNRSTRGGHRDPVIVRYRTLSQADELDEVEAQEYTQLFHRMYSRWRWRQATAQVVASKRLG